MPTITFNGESFTVDHAVKGADYIHGFDADGILIVAFDGVANFSAFSYNGTYMNPSDCLAEQCNNMVYCGGVVKTRGGTTVPPSAIGAAPSSHVTDKSNPHGVTAEQAGARPNTWMPTASEVGARPNTWTPTATDVGARPNTWMPTAADVGAAAASHTHAFADDITGTVSASRGGTGRSSLTSGRYLVGNGSSAVTLRTSADVLTDIGAASYEEGTWTPTDVNSCGLTFSSATMNYTKIGRFVHVLLKLKTASSTKGKAITIGGLPFEPNCTYPSSLGLWADQQGSGANTKQGIVATGAASVSPTYSAELKNTDGTALKDSTLGASVQIVINLYYQVR